MIDLLDRGAATTRTEAFVDGAFAFSLTLLAIAGDHIPGSVGELINAVKGLPAYAMSFLIVIKVWTGHVEWSRTYGLDDVPSRKLSLLLVFLLLVFVYPLKMVFAALFSALSHGYFPANFVITSYAELSALFITFGLAFGSLGLTLCLLHAHAWREREQLGLDSGERTVAKARWLCWGLVVVVAATSIVLALLIPGRQTSGWWLGVPGYIYFVLNIATPLIMRRAERASLRVV